MDNIKIGLTSLFRALMIEPINGSLRGAQGRSALEAAG